jgi:hypothetical protein
MQSVTVLSSFAGIVAIAAVVIGTAQVQRGKPVSGMALATFGMMILWRLQHAGR